MRLLLPVARQNNISDADAHNVNATFDLIRSLSFLLDAAMGFDFSIAFKVTGLTLSYLTLEHLFCINVVPNTKKLLAHR